jgi:ribose transport system substrate-binding protein
MRKLPTIFATAVLSLGLYGCSGESETGSSADAPEFRGKIGATCMTLANPFFSTIQQAMEEEAAKHGYEVVYLSADMQPDKQLNQVKDFIVQEVAAIAINPCNSKTIGSVIIEANEAGIPVFTFDVKSQDPEAKVVSHIGTDNFQGGQLAAEAMIEALGEAGGDVVIIDYASVESCQERVRGFKDVVAKHNDGRSEGTLNIVVELPGEGSDTQGLRAAEDALQAHPDIVGIFAINDPSGLGAVAALEKAGKLDHVTVVAFDGQEIGKRAILNGKIYADPIQFPKKIGQKTIRSIVAHLSGDDVPADQPIASALYRHADALKDPELKQP